LISDGTLAPLTLTSHPTPHRAAFSISHAACAAPREHCHCELWPRSSLHDRREMLY